MQKTLVRLQGTEWEEGDPVALVSVMQKPLVQLQAGTWLTVGEVILFISSVTVLVQPSTHSYEEEIGSECRLTVILRPSRNFFFSPPTNYLLTIKGKRPVARGVNLHPKPMYKEPVQKPAVIFPEAGSFVGCVPAIFLPPQINCALIQRLNERDEAGSFLRRGAEHGAVHYPGIHLHLGDPNYLWKKDP
ncbi:hypothetical protein B0H17DRAFT_1125077 [Mycena rosella]|uniref:Uncharacterized protein n=1 Tax=Mycena rosella TaxID=1033263 RepID=A0AAD7GZA1_MYCRO|nr:hypothetical protein B0H17DRAFT_1125077 [Mycena rosella]